MNKRGLKKIITGVWLALVVLCVIAIITSLTQGHTWAVLEPKGAVAAQQKQLLIIVTLLISLVVVPVLILAVVIAWRYREGNKKATYTPEWGGSTKLELTWWGIPLLIIAVLSGIIWWSSHQLDPYRPLDSTQLPLKIQVVALQYKWLFIYPEQGIATVNQVTIPTKRPVEFIITADAPMNSFWVPQLAGQIYAMPGMSTQLHLTATSIGSYRGSSANISGSGYADMNFMVNAMPENQFFRWVADVQETSGNLTNREYSRLAKPGTIDANIYYGSVTDQLYATILKKYVGSPSSQPESMSGHAMEY